MGAIALGVWYWNPSPITVLAALLIFLVVARRLALRSMP
jgi:hypothetical protein